MGRSPGQRRTGSSGGAEFHIAEVQVGGSWAAWVEVEGNEAELMSLGSWKIGSEQDVLVRDDGAGWDGSIIDSDSDSNDEGILELMEWRYTEESSSEEEEEELDQEQGRRRCQLQVARSCQAKRAALAPAPVVAKVLAKKSKGRKKKKHDATPDWAKAAPASSSTKAAASRKVLKSTPACARAASAPDKAGTKPVAAQEKSQRKRQQKPRPPRPWLPSRRGAQAAAATAEGGIGNCEGGIGGGTGTGGLRIRVMAEVAPEHATAFTVSLPKKEQRCEHLSTYGTLSRLL